MHTRLGHCTRGDRSPEYSLLASTPPCNRFLNKTPLFPALLQRELLAELQTPSTTSIALERWASAFSSCYSHRILDPSPFPMASHYRRGKRPSPEAEPSCPGNAWRVLVALAAGTYPGFTGHSSTCPKLPPCHGPRRSPQQPRHHLALAANHPPGVVGAAAHPQLPTKLVSRARSPSSNCNPTDAAT